MTPQALHNAVHGFLLPAPQPGPQLPSWALWAAALLFCAAIITYPWRKK